MKIRTIGYLTGFILFAAGITAVAEEIKPDPLSTTEYEELSTRIDKGSDCIFSRSINDWTILDDQSLIIYAPSKNKPYYVKLSIRSHELKYANSIGVYSKFDNRFCPYGGNALFIDGTRYAIWAIKKIDNDTAKQLIAYNRNKTKKP